MNRTKDEIVKHAKEAGYTKMAIAKISGFLIGLGLKEESETLFWKIGDNKWEHFYRWFNGYEKREKTVFDTLAEDIFERLDNSNTEKEKERYRKQLEWLCKNHIKTVDKRK